MQRFHYFPTPPFAFCGVPAGPQTIGTGDRAEFFAHYASGAETHCHKCVRRMRSWAEFRAELQAADKLRALNLGFTT